MRCCRHPTSVLAAVLVFAVLAATEDADCSETLARQASMLKSLHATELHRAQTHAHDSTSIPWTLNCTLLPNGGRKYLRNCTGTYREYARQILGDRCFDIKMKVFLSEDMQNYGGGPGPSMIAIANSLDVMGIKTWAFHDTKLHGEIDSGDDTEYEILWAPIWFATERFGPYLTPNTQFSYKTAKNFSLIIGPNVILPGQINAYFYRPGNNHFIFPSRWAAQSHRLKLPEAQLETVRVYPTPTYIDVFQFDPATFCASTPPRPPRSELSEDITTAKCVFYHKYAAHDVVIARNATQLALDSLGMHCKVMEYGHYSMDMFREMICAADFVIISDSTETQGYAESEMMSLDVPLFFVSSGLDTNRVELTVPYFCEECGDFYEPASPFHGTPLKAMSVDIAGKLKSF